MSHTPGPWRWVLSETYKRVTLEGGVPRFDLTVVDFVRYGMSHAAPRFREDVDRMNIMHRAEVWGAKVAGREHHADWFKTINHPDARLIAAAPDLLEAAKAVCWFDWSDNDKDPCAAIDRLRAAIAKATVPGF